MSQSASSLKLPKLPAFRILGDEVHIFLLACLRRRARPSRGQLRSNNPFSRFRSPEKENWITVRKPRENRLSSTSLFRRAFEDGAWGEDFERRPMKRRARPRRLIRFDRPGMQILGMSPRGNNEKLIVLDVVWNELGEFKIKRVLRCF